MGQFFEKAYDEMLEIKENCIKEAFKEPKVSIIVPAYNTEKYIYKCLLSLISQTLKEIEIIIINDGSTDSTPFIIKKFSDADGRIKVITQTNQKQGAARNRGTEIAKGEYIGFVDSDDWVDLDYYEKLYNSAKKYDSDIALATNIRVGGKKKTKKRIQIECEKLATDMQSKFHICKHFGNECPTNKIYKAKLLNENNIVWPEGVYCEDKLFVTQALYYANKVVSVPDINYYYFRNPKSTVNNKTINHSLKKINDKNDAKLAVLKFLREKQAEINLGKFCAITHKITFCKIPILVTKENLNYKKVFLFNFIAIKTSKIKG